MEVILLNNLAVKIATPKRKYKILAILLASLIYYCEHNRAFTWATCTIKRYAKYI